MVPMSPQTLEESSRLVQQVLWVQAVSATMSNAFLPSILWMHLRLLGLRVQYCLMRVRIVHRLCPARSFSSPGSNTVGTTFSQPDIFFLSVASQPEASSIPVSSVPPGKFLAVLPRALFPSDSARPTLHNVAETGPTSADTASLSHASL